ncbi:MAG: antibiotic biosynthesis monooxygenase [Hyphomicrobiales bacterium]|nr:MAG: antibiotic biosynthesis monooxygenase [Hyphomicrobiales bacterium]
MLYVIATFKVKAGSARIIKQKVGFAIDATRQEAGCISYDLSQSVEDENVFTFVERWENRTALDAHFTMPHFAKWREIGAEHVVERSIEIIEDGKIEKL